MFEIYAYGNVESLNGVFNAIAAIMGGGDYLDLIRTIALLGLLIALFSGLLSPNRAQFHGWGWFAGFMLVYSLAFVPRATVVVTDRLGSKPAVAIDNVPLGVAFFGHFTSKVGDVLTRFFETAFQAVPDAAAQLPGNLSYQGNGVMFGHRIVELTRGINANSPQLRADLIAFVNNCTLYDLSDGAEAGGIDPKEFGESLDIWPLMASTSPGRFSTYGNPATVDTCVKVYEALGKALPAQIAETRARLALRLNPALSAEEADAAVDAQIQAAYRKLLGAAAEGVAGLIRQNILVNVIQDTSLIKGQQINDPASVMLATSKAQATASINSSYLTMGAIAAEALPLVRNAVEAVVYAIFPFVLLLMLLASGRGLGLVIKSFVMALVWIQLWPPLYAVLNYVATLAGAQHLKAAATLPGELQGLALDTAAAVYSGAISDQAVAGYLVISIPIIATAIIKGGEVAFQAVTGVAAIQSAAQSEGAKAGSGVVNQGIANVDKYSLDAQHTAPNMVTTTDRFGDKSTTMVGTGTQAVSFLQNNPGYLSGKFSAERVRGLEQAATKATETARQDSIAAATETVSALAETVSRSRDRVSSQELGSTVSEASGSGLAETHNRVKGIADELKRRYGFDEQDAATVAIAAQGGLGFNIAQRAIQSKGKSASMQQTVPNPGGGTASAGTSGSASATQSGGRTGSLGAGGKLDQQYRASLERAYDEARGNTSTEDQRRAREYFSRLSQDEQFRSAVGSHQVDAAATSASFTRARKAVEQAQASLARREALAEQARIAETQGESVAYDWTKDPTHREDLLAMRARLQGVQDLDAQRQIVENYFAEKALSRPTRYLSGDKVRWSSGQVTEVYGKERASSDLHAPARVDYSRNAGRIGAGTTTPVQDSGISARVIADRAAAGEEVAGVGARIVKDRIAAQQRFNKESGLADQSRDGEFGSKQSTATRAFSNAVTDGQRSVESFKEAAQEAVFGPIDRFLSGDQREKK